jgi:hypothetical protein
VQRAIEDAAAPIERQSSLRIEAEVEQIAYGYALTLSVQTATGASRAVPVEVPELEHSAQTSEQAGADLPGAKRAICR